MKAGVRNLHMTEHVKFARALEALTRAADNGGFERDR